MRRIAAAAILFVCASAHAQKTIAPALKSMRIAGPVVGSQPTIGRVDLTSASPDRLGTLITFTSADPHVPPPESVKVPMGQSWADFAVKTLAVAAQMSVTLTAHAGPASQTEASFTLIPPSLDLFDCQPKTLPGGSHATCKAWMNGLVARGGELTINVTTSNAQVAKPSASTVKVAADTRWVAIDVLMGDLPQSAKATISVSYNGVTKTSDLEVTPAAIASFGCEVRTTLDPSRTGQSDCTVFGGDYNLNGQQTEVGFIVHLTAKAPYGGYKIPLTIDFGDAAPLGMNIPQTLEVTAGKDAGVFPFKTGPVGKTLVLKVTAKDPITHNTYPTSLTIKPPVVYGVRFYPEGTSGVPLGGRDVTVYVHLRTPAPSQGMVYDVTYSGTTDFKGPAQVRVHSMDGQFTAHVSPCAVNPPCKVSATVGGVPATMTVNP